LISAFIITSIKQNTTQKAVAATLTLIGVILAFSLCFSTTALHLILLIYSIKLILAFSVNWTTSNK
jgi:diacylglycerol kinase